MPRALIAGCGYLGRAIADLLAVEAWDVECWTVSGESARELSKAGYSARNVDISKGKDVGAHKSEFDVVVHCASTRGGNADAYRRVYFDGVRNLLEHFGNARLLFVSSTSVYAQNTGERVSEESPAEPKHETGQILRESEDLILKNRGIAVRLGGLYGPGRSALLEKLLSGEAKINPEHDRFMNQIHRDDAAAAIQFLVGQTNLERQIYNLVDNQPTLLSECYRWLAGKLSRPIPSTERSPSKRKRGNSNKRVSNAKLRGLEWAPRYPTFADGMEKSVLQIAPGKGV
ncbi:MAG TPA: NAD-dependent epimerase/dehydratase family protein [Chthoniobacterales bacterium]|nr:NAD-dependent epimerase/dehydratase family protein [Chthoniobacterales bacterium]